jgi:protein phosphatase
MSFDAWCASDVGLKRESNQDSFLINADLGLFIVADGMGGHSGGEVASAMAVETVSQVVADHHRQKSSLNPKSLLIAAYKEASQRIFGKSEVESPELKGMGTTLVVGLYRDGHMYVGNVGDSRAYLFSSPYFWQITEDHSLINEQIRAGLLSEHNAHRFVGRNVITRSVGFERQVDVDVLERKMAPGEMILICSDGLTGLVPDYRIAEICESVPAETIVERCIIEAKANGGDDNITVMLIRIND